jgi:hypothetical protein
MAISQGKIDVSQRKKEEKARQPKTPSRPKPPKKR